MERKSVVARSMPEWQRPLVAVPLQQAFPQLGEIKEFRSKTCLFNHDRTRLFDVVSSRYQVIEHPEAIGMISQGLEAVFDAPVSYTVRSVNGGARIKAEFSLPIKPIKIHGNDISELKLILRNSYDRAWKFQANLGAFRLICSNGMMIGESFGSISAKHIGVAEDINAPLLESLADMIQRAPELRNLWTDWQDTRMTFEEAQELLEGQFPDKYLAPVLAEESYPKSKWDLYNQLTAFATHDTKSPNRRMEFDEKIAQLFYDTAEE